MQAFLRPTIEQYKNFGIYRHMPIAELLNRILVLKSCQFESLIDKGPHLYEKSRKVLGGKITDGIIMNTIGKMFVAGADSKDLKATIDKVNGWGQGAVAYYVAEALDGRPFEEKVGLTNLGF